jgi:hypothetical protein
MQDKGGNEDGRGKQDEKKVSVVLANEVSGHPSSVMM